MRLIWNGTKKLYLSIPLDLGYHKMTQIDTIFFLIFENILS